MACRLVNPSFLLSECPIKTKLAPSWTNLFICRCISSGVPNSTYCEPQNISESASTDETCARWSFSGIATTTFSDEPNDDLYCSASATDISLSNFLFQLQPTKPFSAINFVLNCLIFVLHEETTFSSVGLSLKISWNILIAAIVFPFLANFCAVNILSIPYRLTISSRNAPSRVYLLMAFLKWRRASLLASSVSVSVSSLRFAFSSSRKALRLSGLSSLSQSANTFSALLNILKFR